jgi:hypothetical protein
VYFRSSSQHFGFALIDRHSPDAHACDGVELGLFLDFPILANIGGQQRKADVCQDREPEPTRLGHLSIISKISSWLAGSDTLSSEGVKPGPPRLISHSQRSGSPSAASSSLHASVPDPRLHMCTRRRIGPQPGSAKGEPGMQSYCFFSGGSGIIVSIAIFQPPSACFFQTLTYLAVISTILPLLSLAFTFPVPHV